MGVRRVGGMGVGVWGGYRCGGWVFGWLEGWV